MAILSIQSSVAYGRVGNRAASFILERLGYEVWPLDTVRFSNHPGHGGFTGMVTPAAEIGALIDGLDRLGVLVGCQAVLSGYLGEAATAAQVHRALAKAREVRPCCLLCCDPVMGDADKGLYVHPDIPEAIRAHLLPEADLLTPNLFELGLLAGGTPITERAATLAAARRLLERGPRLVAVTSFEDSGTAAAIETLAVTAEGAWRIATPRLPLLAKGTGDAFSALLLAHYLKTRSGPEAVSLAVSALYAVLETTAALRSRELLLIDRQNALASPPKIFPAEALP